MPLKETISKNKKNRTHENSSKIYCTHTNIRKQSQKTDTNKKWKQKQKTRSKTEPKTITKKIKQKEYRSINKINPNKQT